MRKVLLFTIVIIWVMTVSTYSAPGDALWTRIYGGTEDDHANSVQQTIDGGYIIAGHTESFGNNYCSIYLVKTDASGDTRWTRTYGGTMIAGANSVQQTTDDGYIIAAYREGSAHSDFYFIKTDSNGDTIWTRYYGGDGYDDAYSAQQTTDGGFIVAGYTSPIPPAPILSMIW